MQGKTVNNEEPILVPKLYEYELLTEILDIPFENSSILGKIEKIRSEMEKGEAFPTEEFLSFRKNEFHSFSFIKMNNYETITATNEQKGLDILNNLNFSPRSNYK